MQCHSLCKFSFAARRRAQDHDDDELFVGEAGRGLLVRRFIGTGIMPLPVAADVLVARPVARGVSPGRHAPVREHAHTCTDHTHGRHVCRVLRSQSRSPSRPRSSSRSGLFGAPANSRGARRQSPRGRRAPRAPNTRARREPSLRAPSRENVLARPRRRRAPTPKRQRSRLRCRARTRLFLASSRSPLSSIFLRLFIFFLLSFVLSRLYVPVQPVRVPA